MHCGGKLGAHETILLWLGSWFYKLAGLWILSYICGHVAITC